MSQKKHSISVRISDEDLAFLEKLQIDDAQTPSEKMRFIIRQAKLREAGNYSYNAALTVMRELLEPVAGKIRQLERTEQSHSELVIHTYHWLKEITAYMLSGIDQEDDVSEILDLPTLEANVLDRLLRNMEHVLRLAVTETSPCYNPRLIHEQIKPVLDLTDMVKKQISSNHK